MFNSLPINHVVYKYVDRYHEYKQLIQIQGRRKLSSIGGAKKVLDHYYSNVYFGAAKGSTMHHDQQILGAQEPSSPTSHISATLQISYNDTTKYSDTS